MKKYKKVLIWGTGKMANDFIQTSKISKNVELIGFVETNPIKKKFMDKEVFSVKKLHDVKYDFIVICSTFTDEIIQTLLWQHISFDNIIFLKRTKLSESLGITLHYLSEIVDNIPDFYQLINQEREIKILRTGADYWNESLLMDYNFNDNNMLLDYVRYRTFEFVADEIKEKKIENKGSVAEVGVFRGDFSRLINAKFPNNKMYLFDTFNGFDNSEANDAIQNNFSNEEFVNVFKNTSIEYVLSRMIYPQKCIIKQGLFPQTVQELDEKFIFVSIDVDYEESIYQSLLYFYPRLVEGGFIFVHDYHHLFLKGVKLAINRYEKEFGKLTKIPIADAAGTLIIVK